MEKLPGQGEICLSSMVGCLDLDLKNLKQSDRVERLLKTFGRNSSRWDTFELSPRCRSSTRTFAGYVVRDSLGTTCHSELTLNPSSR